MLDLTAKGTCTTTDGIIWDYYGDDSNPKVFYAVPIPTLATDATGTPIFSLVEYSANTQAPASGYCYLSTLLWIPPADVPQIVECINKARPGVTPQLTTLQFREGGEARLQFATGDGAVSQQAYARTSSYGANVATFLVSLDGAGIALFKALFGGTSTGGTLSLTYQVSVPARLPAVEVTVKFDSAIAYEYQKRHTIR